MCSIEVPESAEREWPTILGTGLERTHLLEVLMVDAANLVELDHFVVGKHAHVLVSAHAVGAQEFGAICTARDRLEVGLAARAAQRGLLDGKHVEHVVHHVVVF